jgi:hypothetical protein
MDSHGGTILTEKSGNNSEKKFRVFWDIVPRSRAVFALGSLIALMMEAARTTKTSVDICLTTRRRENLKSHNSEENLSQCNFVHHKFHGDLSWGRTRASAVTGRGLTA